MLAGLGMVGALMYLVGYAFVPLGQLLGRNFREHPRPIRAYSVNILGSLAGVWIFNALSSASSPPAVWFALASAFTVALVLLRGSQGGWLTAGLIATSAVVAWLGEFPNHSSVWSPYQKLTLSPYYVQGGSNLVLRGYLLSVNGVHFQEIADSSDKFFESHPELLDISAIKLRRFDTPFALKPNARRVLIVGAGGGNNAADALRFGVQDVDCVEIDPEIYAFGKHYHPEHPYDSPRVHMTVNDARAYFKQAKGPYDVIWFAWLDSHTLGSAYNNLRLDHYVYTAESFREVRRLLAADGIVFINFVAERPWIADRLYALLRDVFGHDPLVYQRVWRKLNGKPEVWYVLVAGKQPVDLNRQADAGVRETLQANVIEMPGTTRETTDDWPYLYLPRASIPKLHLAMSLVILGTIAAAGPRAFGFRGWIDWHFFALGAAFLLLEVQTVSRATLLFGMTWVVNAIVISAVLIMILLANLVAARWPRLPQRLIVTGLALTVAALAFVPLDTFNALTGATKVVVASAFLTAPVFFAGLIFIRSFAVCPDKCQALGSNLIGALVGGLLESISFVTGIRALVLLVGAFYVCALLVRPRLTQDLQPADQRS
jgi:SAM-dependent methyltransferase